MFRIDTPTKAFVVVNREEPHYEDNFTAALSDDGFVRKTGTAPVEARMADLRAVSAGGEGLHA